MRIRTRFAPTPSGYLHLGNAWSFVLTWLAARSEKGSLHLRIDDLDAARSRDEYLEDIFTSLQWLGLDWDSGPRNASEFKSDHSQRLRMNRYQEALNQLQTSGAVYACNCSREQMRRDSEASGIAVYTGTCRHKGLDLREQEYAWRYAVSKSAVKVRDEQGGVFELHPHRDMGDFVVRQKNGNPAYQLASVVDDTDLNINFIVRGLDLIPSTGAQISLSNALDKSVGLKVSALSEARFWHHPLILDDAGEKLSKSTGMESLRAIREKFSDPSSVYRFFARRLGMEAEAISSAQDLLSRFKIEKVATMPSMPLRLSDFWRESGD